VPAGDVAAGELGDGDPAPDRDHRRVVPVVETDDELSGRCDGPGAAQADDDVLELTGRDLAGAATAVGVGRQRGAGPWARSHRRR